MAPATDRRRRRVAAVIAVVAAAVVSGCATAPRATVDPLRMDEAVAAFDRPLAGDLAALYRMRAPRTGGLSLAVITAGGAGRWTIAEPFGAALSLTAWTDVGETVLFDMEAGCRRPVDDLREVLGVDAFPMAQAARLLGGRLPAAPGDEVTVIGGGQFEVRGDDWGVKVYVAADPWRVVEVRPIDGRWRVKLDDHRDSVPGRIHVKAGRGRWAELELSRIEWPEDASLPVLPGFPPCDGR